MEQIETTDTTRRPSLALSLVPIGVMVVLLFFTIQVFGSDALAGGSQIVLITTTACASALAMLFCPLRQAFRKVWKPPIRS